MGYSDCPAERVLYRISARLPSFLSTCLWPRQSVVPPHPFPRCGGEKTATVGLKSYQYFATVIPPLDTSGIVQ